MRIQYARQRKTKCGNILTTSLNKDKSGVENMCETCDCVLTCSKWVYLPHEVPSFTWFNLVSNLYSCVWSPVEINILYYSTRDVYLL